VNKRLMAALLAWTGLLTVFMAAMLLFTNPAPSDAQTGVASFGTVRVGAFIRAVPRTTITVTMNGFVTSTGTYQRIAAAGTVATSGAKIAIKPAGTILTLLNSGSNSITFTETGTLISAGNIVLAANDAATLISDGTNWTEIGASNN
jgi:hypothetical protein